MRSVWSPAKRRAIGDLAFARANADVLAHPEKFTRLRKLRVDRSLTQAQVAEAANLSRQSYIKIEKDQTQPQVSTQNRIAAVLEMRPVEIWGTERDQEREQLVEERRYLPLPPGWR